MDGLMSPTFAFERRTWICRVWSSKSQLNHPSYLWALVVVVVVASVVLWLLLMGG